jgi:hypothetical protein
MIDRLEISYQTNPRLYNILVNIVSVNRNTNEVLELGNSNELAFVFLIYLSTLIRPVRSTQLLRFHVALMLLRSLTRMWLKNSTSSSVNGLCVKNTRFYLELLRGSSS